VVVHTYHGFGFHDRQAWWLKSVYILAERLAGALATALVFVSRANEDYARRHRLGDPRRHVIIRSGVKLSDFPAACGREAKKRELGLPASAPMVLSIGNLKPQKNPAQFLALARLATAAVPEAVFVFVGDGPMRESIAAGAAKAGLGGRFLMLGWRRDVAELLAAADVFVLTSLWEGLPRALVEAMKSGVPPVCYATDGVEDLVRDGENGFLVAQGDTPALARRVLDLLNDKALRLKVGQAAAASIGEEFDIARMVRQQEDLYLRLLNKHLPGPEDKDEQRP